VKHNGGVTASATADSARKRQLLELAYAYVLDHGLADMSLRPLAEAVGSSPRVLLFLFGSKEALVQALLARARQDELRVLDAVRSDQDGKQDGRQHDLARVGALVWEWLAAPEHLRLNTLWVQSYARSLTDDSGPWADFARRTVTDWLDLLAAAQPPAHRDSPAAEAERALLLAVLRGALLDLLATGDRPRNDAAVAAHLAAIAPGRD
jgi:AcrR family transcriptional regulator